ncbi:MAG: hypothetical protein V1754_11880 [Pseudomonadota bacterium]
MSWIFRVIFWAAFTLILAAGCSGERIYEDEVLAEARSFGFLSVTYSHDRAKGDGLLVLTTSAQFVRYTDMSRRQVELLLALPLDPSEDLPIEDMCKIYDLSVDPSLDSEEGGEERGNVELLEAGELKVQTSAGLLTLVPRHFPGLLPFIGGVIYGETQATEVEKVGEVVAFSDGGEDVGEFRVQQIASPVLPGLVFEDNGDPNQGGRVLVVGGGLSLRWTPGEAEGDTAYIEVRSSRNKRDLVLRCRPQDDGAFEIPPAALSELVVEGGDQIVLDISRFHRAEFVAPGLDQGELRVTVSDRVSIQLQ